MALATANLAASAIKAALGVATLKAIFYNGATLKTAAELGAVVNKDGLNPTYCPGADATARLANLLANRRLSYFKGYVSIINYLTASGAWIGSTYGATTNFYISANVAWTFTCNVDWFTFSAQSGNGDANILITVLNDNYINEARVGTITLTGAGITIEAHITQSASGDMRA